MISLESVNPTTGEVLRSFPALQGADVLARVALAAQAATLQRHLPIEHRSLCLRKLAALLELEQAEIAGLITLETGKPIRATREEVARASMLCRYYAEHAGRLLAPRPLHSAGAQAYLRWNPLGVVLAVLPWQSPLWQAFQCIIPALAAGNAVLLKHAASVPQCALLIAALARRAGFDRGAVCALLIDEASIESVLHDPRVAAVSVSGPETACQALAAHAGGLLKQSHVHLSGNDAMVVMPSADLDAAVTAATHALAAGGSEGKRIVLHTAIFSDFAREFTERAEALRVGDPMREETEVGPLGTAAALTRLHDQVDAAVKGGARLLLGGARMIGRGYFYEPTLLSEPQRTPASAVQPLAGPVALLIAADGIEESIATANSTPHRQAATIWTQEPGEQEQLIRGICAATIACNRLLTGDAASPSVNSVRSGWEAGLAGMQDFLQPTTVVLT